MFDDLDNYLAGFLQNLAENAEDQIAQAHERLNEIFPTRMDFLGAQLIHYARTGQVFDVTFYNREPILEVTLDCAFAHQWLDNVSAPRTHANFEQFCELCDKITFSDGTSVVVDEIWTLNYMPREGFDNETLASVDTAQAEVKAGDHGETIREMIRNTYRCRSAAEEDFFVRRWIAS